MIEIYSWQYYAHLAGFALAVAFLVSLLQSKSDDASDDDDDDDDELDDSDAWQILNEGYERGYIRFSVSRKGTPIYHWVEPEKKDVKAVAAAKGNQ